MFLFLEKPYLGRLFGTEDFKISNYFSSNFSSQEKASIIFHH